MNDPTTSQYDDTDLRVMALQLAVKAKAAEHEPGVTSAVTLAEQFLKFLKGETA